MSESPEPFFRRQGDGFEPNPICRGPWGPTTLHGRVVAGLLAREAERAYGDDSFRVARMTVDLYRMPVFAPVEVRTTPVRQSHRIRVVDAEFVNGGQSAGRASIVFLRRTENPTGTVWSPAGWDAPAPAETPRQERPPGRIDWEPMWETRPISGQFGAPGPKRCWIREVRPLVEGEPLTPFQRVALAADFTSPFANSGSNGLEFLNVDISLYLHRYPRTEWVGFDVLAHHADEGIAVGECMLYDEHDPIGRGLVAAVTNLRRDDSKG